MKSTLKTTAAVLRSIAGEKDSVWATDIMGKSVHTIRHLEAGSLPLSPSMAAKMNHETGISIKWLMNGDEKAPPVAANGEPYTKAIYDDVQARKKTFARVGDDNVRLNVLQFWKIICAIMVNANRNKNFYMAFYRTDKAISQLWKELGIAKDLLPPDGSPEKVLAFMRPILEFNPDQPSKRPSKKKRR
jgi:hypothetical protein